MTIWTIGWIALGLAALTLETVALINSERGDTLSEHIWVFTGVRRPEWYHNRYGNTPKWTVRVARLVVLTFLGWLAVHLTTGWM